MRRETIRIFCPGTGNASGLNLLGQHRAALIKGARSGQDKRRQR